MNSSEEMRLAFIKTIPFTELFDKIKEVVGLDDLVFEQTVRQNYADESFPCYSSQDLADRVGFLTPLFKHIYIQQFNSQVVIDYDTYGGVLPLRYWGTVCFAYEHRPCGSNAHTFMDCRYDESNGWEFKVYE